MTETRRKFTPEDRLSILHEAECERHAARIRKYHLAPSLYARWKHKYFKSWHMEFLPGQKKSFSSIDLNRYSSYI